jgi:hypothetical protein
METLAGCFVLSVFCESLIVDPKPFTSEVFMGMADPGRGDTWLVGKVVPHLQSVKLISIMLTVKSSLDPHMIIELEDGNKS